ncbi:homeobox protein BarH-like 1 isoform X2 [Oxyura jamaicensis]|uniref:homeobox protein BarH-like 1 isoform X2 n=1 Tax=Oxyura jamaicensis TaxID=8884 RepID=UPI0015A6BA25|nr:homeobox protein BarH-like 1 isoform X2 [Oxyura jamaicensis]
MQFAACRAARRDFVQQRWFCRGRGGGTRTEVPYSPPLGIAAGFLGPGRAAAAPARGQRGAAGPGRAPRALQGSAGAERGLSRSVPALGWAHSSVPSRELLALLPSEFSQPSRGLRIPEEDAIVCGLKSRCGARRKMRFDCSGIESALRGSGQGNPKEAPGPVPAARTGAKPSRRPWLRQLFGGIGWERLGIVLKRFRLYAGNHPPC